MGSEWMPAIVTAAGLVLVGLITYRQARKGATDSPYEALASRVTAQEARIDDLTTRLDLTRKELREAKHDLSDLRAEYDQTLAENMALADHHLATVRGIALGTVPPWLPIPKALRARLSEADYPPIEPA